MFLLRAVLLLLCSATSLVVYASPWIDVGNERLRHSIELLNGAGLTNIPTTTWPVMWSDVKAGLDNIPSAKLGSVNRSEKLAIEELMFELAYQTRQGVKRSFQVSASNGRSLFRDFGSSAIEQYEFAHRLDWDGERFAVRLSSNVTSDSSDDAESQFDGSYALAVLGDWAIGLGAVDRWWGPGQQSSLILSSNARPVPALQFRTKASQEFESSWLSWVGAWQFDSFLGQLESSRAISEAKLLGMRFTFQPFPSFEVGLSRAAQFGGEGRSEGLETFIDALTTVGENSEEGAGNQLAGVDLKYSFRWFNRLPASVYMQSIGEDEAGFLPSRRIYQFGFRSLVNKHDNGDSLSAFAEFNNTISDDLFSDGFFNTAYEHGTYQSGYRLRGRSIASTFDNDAQVITAGLNYVKTNGELIGLVLTYADLNKDGRRRNNSVTAFNESLYYVKANYQRYLFEGKFKIQLEHFSDDIRTVQDDIEQTRIGFAWEYRY